MFFFFNDTATTEIYTLSLHDALPIWMNFTWFASSYDTDDVPYRLMTMVQMAGVLVLTAGVPVAFADRSEEHTSELQSRQYLVCRLLLEKKKSQLFLFFVLLL